MKHLLNTLFTLGFLLASGLTHAAEYEVKMLNSGSEGFMVFEPAVLSVEVGDTVNFVATDMAHNSASIAGMIPDGAEPWSGQLNEDISVTFDKPGVYAYQCTPHAMMAMVGVINVGQDKANLPAVKTAALNKKASFVTNKDRLDNYLSQLQ
ncbi:MAG: pseudoazurin [Halioglobus sp.]|nr:pseudoazurin [Halioglobus sp.]